MCLCQIFSYSFVLVLILLRLSFSTRIRFSFFPFKVLIMLQNNMLLFSSSSFPFPLSNHFFDFSNFMIFYSVLLVFCIHTCCPFFFFLSTSVCLYLFHDLVLCLLLNVVIPNTCFAVYIIHSFEFCRPSNFQVELLFWYLRFN